MLVKFDEEVSVSETVQLSSWNGELMNEEQVELGLREQLDDNEG